MYVLWHRAPRRTARSCGVQVLHALSALAECIGDMFLPFYDTFVSGLRGLLATPPLTPDGLVIKARPLARSRLLHGVWVVH